VEAGSIFSNNSFQSLYTHEEWNAKCKARQSWRCAWSFLSGLRENFPWWQPWQRVLSKCKLYSVNSFCASEWSARPL